MAEIGLRAEEDRPFYVHLAFAAAITGCVVIVFFPALIVHSKLTGVAFFALRGFGTIAGLATYVYYVLKIARGALVKGIDRIAPLERIVLGTATTLLLLVTPFLLYHFRKIGYALPGYYGEGWNILHTSRFLHGGPLYPPITEFPLTPVNYPPVSFLLIGAMDHFTRSYLATGQLISLVAFMFVGVLIFSIINTVHASKYAACLGALLWLALMVRVGRGMLAYDPQMVGHAFSTGALYLYCRWSDKLTLRKTGVLAFLCCVGLFTKFILIAVPITLGITLLVRDKRSFGVFALAGVVVAILMVLGSWLVFGQNFFTNILVEQTRPWWFIAWLHLVNWVFVYHFCIVFLVIPAMLLLKFEKRWMFALVYFAVSLVVGSYFSGDRGLAQNAWFDFFISASIVLGVLAAAFAEQSGARARVAVGGVLVACLLPCLLPDLKSDIQDAVDYGGLRREERAHRKDVERLRSIPGPALFEDLLLGYDAGKEYLFDPFLGTELIVSKRIPERTLTGRIRERYFAVIVLDFDVAKVLTYLDTSRRGSLEPSATLTERWTDNTLIAIQENYESLNQDRSDTHFYVPRGRLMIPSSGFRWSHRVSEWTRDE